MAWEQEEFQKRIKSLRENGIMIEIFFPSYFPFIKIEIYELIIEIIEK